MQTRFRCHVPEYPESPLYPARLPEEGRFWYPGKRGAIARNDPHPLELANAVLQADTRSTWQWPERPCFFISDLHADGDALNASLLASGGIRLQQDSDEIELTQAGRAGLFIIGGDCLDKGPSNLTLLRGLANLCRSGADVRLLAGNHDVRLLLGLQALVQPRGPLTEHLFLRMGEKVIPLFREILEEYVWSGRCRIKVPDLAVCREQLYPGSDWFETFPQAAAGQLNAFAIQRELKGMRRKVRNFESACHKSGFGLQDAYAAAMACRQLFLEPSGEFSWFFQEMQLLHREGSFLFVHAGLDDGLVERIRESGVAPINRQYQLAWRSDLFGFYFGSLANTLRTKYRESDKPLSSAGVQELHRLGIHTVVHGHRNRLHGQQIMLRQGLIHIECDITLDRHSRRKEGLKGFGAGVTIVHPEGQVLGISTDHPHIKVFEPAIYLQQAGKQIPCARNTPSDMSHSKTAKALRSFSSQLPRASAKAG